MQQPDSGPIDPRPIGTSPLPSRAYSPGQVAGAAFLGSPIAGCILLASNFVLFGVPNRRQQALLGGVLATFAVTVLAFLLPENFPNLALPAAYTFALQQIATRTQGDDFDAYVASGGSKHSNWRVFGIGLLCMVVFLTALLAAALVLPEEWLPDVAA